MCTVNKFYQGLLTIFSSKMIAKDQFIFGIVVLLVFCYAAGKFYGLFKSWSINTQMSISLFGDNR